MREKGEISLSGAFEIQAAKPADARQNIPTKKELFDPATWTANDRGIYAYKGMLVSVHSDEVEINNGLYRLKSMPYTEKDNWELLSDSSLFYKKTETASIEEIQTLLEQKEDKNTVGNNYYVSSLQELIIAWEEAINSVLPTSIYAAGTLTLLADTILPASAVGNQISLIGTPQVVIDLAGFTLTATNPVFKSVVLRNPATTGYLRLNEGYGTFNDILFQTDSLDVSQDGTPIPHITVIGPIRNGVGKININNITHYTNDVSSNAAGLIQPILIRVDSQDIYQALYINIRNVESVLDFHRFSRVELQAVSSVKFFVSGDTSWFYAQTQAEPGTNNIELDSCLNKTASLDNVFLGRISTDEIPSRSLSVDGDGKVKVSTKSVLRVAKLISVTIKETWEIRSVTPFIGMLISIFDDGVNNKLYRLKELPYTTMANWEPVGAATVIKHDDTTEKNSNPEVQHLTSIEKAIALSHTILLTQNGIGIFPTDIVFPYIVVISSLELITNSINYSITIGSKTYNNAVPIASVAVPANTAITINGLTMSGGYSATALLTLIRA